MKRQIYADNAATTQLDKASFEAMTPWLLEEYGNASQQYSFARKPKIALTEAREIIADCIGAKPEEIFFTSGGTESDNWVIKSSAFSDPNKNAMITSAFEHHAVLHSCNTIEKLGYPVAYLWPNEDGYISPSTLKSVITKNTRLVSIMLANNELGTVQPIKELCSIAHENGAVFHTDAVQAVGHIDIDVNDLGVDFLSASAHKFNGPKGIGFLFIREGTKLSPYADGGAQESGERAGTENVASIVGMATALKNNVDSLKENQAYISQLEEELCLALSLKGVRFKKNGGSTKLPGLMSLSFAGFDGEAILHQMDLMGISISTGSACNSVNTELSHVLQAIRLDPVLAEGTIRISLGKNNSREEIQIIANAIERIVKRR